MNIEQGPFHQTFIIWSPGLIGKIVDLKVEIVYMIRIISNFKKLGDLIEFWTFKTKKNATL